LAAAEVAELVASAIISPHNFKMTGKPPRALMLAPSKNRRIKPAFLEQRTNQAWGKQTMKVLP
jgi:hypothetical protein